MAHQSGPSRDWGISSQPLEQWIAGEILQLCQFGAGHSEDECLTDGRSLRRDGEARQPIIVMAEDHAKAYEDARVQDCITCHSPDR
jgi:hypothetical protein